MCFQGFWVTDLSGKICTCIFVVNNKYCFKRFLSIIYIVNFDIDLVIVIDTRPLGLTIISGQGNISLTNVQNSKYFGLTINLIQRKQGSGNGVKPKTL